MTKEAGGRGGRRLFSLFSSISLSFSLTLPEVTHSKPGGEYSLLENTLQRCHFPCLISFLLVTFLALHRGS